MVSPEQVVVPVPDALGVVALAAACTGLAVAADYTVEVVVVVAVAAEAFAVPFELVASSLFSSQC